MYKRYAELCANVFKDRQEVSVLMWLACIPYGSHHSMLMMLMHTHTRVPPVPPIDDISAVTIVRRLRGKTIRTALCCVVHAQ